MKQNLETILKKTVTTYNALVMKVLLLKVAIQEAVRVEGIRCYYNLCGNEIYPNNVKSIQMLLTCKLTGS